MFLEKHAEYNAGPVLGKEIFIEGAGCRLREAREKGCISPCQELG